MPTPSVYADFQNADPQGRVRLTVIGTIESLARSGLRLTDGLCATIHDEELEADGVVRYSADEHIWVAEIDWNAIRPLAAVVSSRRA